MSSEITREAAPRRGAALRRHGCDRYGLSPARLPHLAWRSWSAFGSTGWYDDEAHLVAVVAGTDPDDLKMLFCHEVAHAITCVHGRGDIVGDDAKDSVKGHGPAWQEAAYDRYDAEGIAAYAETNEPYARMRRYIVARRSARRAGRPPAAAVYPCWFASRRPFCEKTVASPRPGPYLGCITKRKEETSMTRRA